MLLYYFPRDDKCSSAWKDAEVNEWMKSRRKGSSSRKRPARSLWVEATRRDWPSDVRQLAAAYAEGADCGFALHDALVEAGESSMARTFRIPGHPLNLKLAENILGGE